VSKYIVTTVGQLAHELDVPRDMNKTTDHRLFQRGRDVVIIA